MLGRTKSPLSLNVASSYALQPPFSHPSASAPNEQSGVTLEPLGRRGSPQHFLLTGESAFGRGCPTASTGRARATVKTVPPSGSYRVRASLTLLHTPGATAQLLMLIEAEIRDN